MDSVRFRERADRLALRGLDKAAKCSGSSFLEFEVNSERYAVALKELSGVLRLQSLTPVAGAHPTLQGLTNMRGEVVPVYSLCALLGMQEGASGTADVLVAKYRNLTIGLAVTRLLDLTQLEQNLKEGDAGFVKSRTEGGVMILDLAALWRLPLFMDGKSDE